MRKIKSSIILDKINSIKKSNPSEFKTNYFFNQLDEEVLYLENDCALVFLQPETDFYRLYFATSDLNKLDVIFKALPAKTDICLNYICKKKIDDDLAQIILNYFYLFVKHERLRTNKIRNKGVVVKHAEINDLDSIYSSLNTNFNKYSDFLPTKEKLKCSIENKTVVVNKQDNKVLGYIIYNVSGVTADFNYLYNNSSNILDAINLTNSFYTDIFNRGIKNVFLWVDEKNVKVKKAHLKSGYLGDNTFNYIFRKKGN